jgi:hypothetical protein
LDEEEMQTRTVGVLGYADDWVLYTRNHQMLRVQNNIQAALDRVAEWSEVNGFTIETREPSRPYNTLEWTNIGGIQKTQNTEAYTGQTTYMETTHRNGESKMQQ